MEKLKIFVAALDLAAIGILSFIFINLITIPLVSPQNSAYTTERQPLFSWGGMQGEYVLYVDDTPAFKTPLATRVEGNAYAPGSELDFGTYYWKVQTGPFSSAVGSFTVGSSVILSRSGDAIKNEGNVELKLSGIGGVTGFFILGVNESAAIEGNENVRAEQA
jgi:hypothetical protein